MISFDLKFIGSIVFLLSLSSCGTLQSFLPSSPEADGESVLKQELRVIDEANDRAASRNKMIQKMMVESDDVCQHYVKQVLAEGGKEFPFREKTNDGLDAKLKSAIALRRFDQADENKTLFASRHVEDPEKDVRIALVKTIIKTRALARIQLKARLDGYITGYSLKQALMDVAAYHHSCSASFAATELARLTTMQMSDATRKASIETLMALRQKLMSEGINTHAVQQKIDALILDY